MRILRSPRRRRRLAKIAVPIVIAVPLILVGIHYSNPGNPGNATGPNVAESGYTVPKKAPFTTTDQRAVHRALKRFIISAVARHDVRRSWDVSGPDLRQGYNRKQWTAAGIPVVPYPAANHGLGQWDFVEYSFKNDVGLEVFLFPKPGSGYAAMTADTEVVKGHDGKWRVNYWMPKKFHGPPAIAAATKHRVHKAIAHTKHRKRPSHSARTVRRISPASDIRRRRRTGWCCCSAGRPTAEERSAPGRQEDRRAVTITISCGSIRRTPTS